MAALSPQTVMFGNPPSSAHKVVPADLADWMKEFEVLATSGGISYFNDDLAALASRSDVANGEFALVLSLADEAGVYERVSDDWEKRAGIPAIFLESLAASEAVSAAAEATASRNVAVASGAEAVAAATSATAAAEASGSVVFAATKLEANALSIALQDGKVVEVMVDESRSDQRTRYRMENGALVFIMVVGGLHPAQNLGDLSDPAAARENLGIGVGYTVRVGKIQADGFGEFCSGVTGGGYSLKIERTGDRVDLVPTDLAGGYNTSKALRHDPAVGVWAALGGFTAGGIISTFSSDFEKLSMVRGNSKALVGLESAGVVLRVNADVTTGTNSARVEPAGTAAPSAISLMTREMGDARYLQYHEPNFESAEQAFTAGVAITATHGLGRVPKNWKVILRCKVANNGHAAGDEIAVTNMVDGDVARGKVAKANGTELSFFSDDTSIQNDVGVTVGATASDWAVVFYAW